MDLKKIEKLSLEKAKIEGIKIIRASKASNDRESDMIKKIENSNDMLSIISLLWNLRLSGEGLAVINVTGKDRYDKNNKKKKKKRKY